MNSQTFCLALLFVALCLGSVFSRVIPEHQNEDEIVSRSKRSQTADHSLNDKVSREKAILARKLNLAILLGKIDTSGQLVASGSPLNFLPSAPTTTTTKINSDTDDSQSKRRKGKGRKGGRKGRKNGKRKNGKRGRRNRRRRIRAVAENIASLLESEHGESILRSIAGAIDEEFTGNWEELSDFVKTTAKKCKCSTSKKSKY